ncbi:ClpP/crotonase-like domain-containing protein [Aspergillus ambiguus]|uniref:enoyl-CoA hydratase/isomerase family protein n=1 Tax=Aspergillus ambiguus TaxID=176160 RepID=UPI003CCDCE4E
MVSNEHIHVEQRGRVFVITLQKPPENRLTMNLCQDLIQTYREIERKLFEGTSAPEGAVILKGKDAKFFTTGLDLDERDTNPHASTDGFYPLLRTILDFPFPTICLITGHTFGGACLLTMAHDYRIMNSSRGFWSMPPVNLGLHFEGMGALLQAKLHPKVARKVLLEAHKFTGKEALEAGIADDIAPPDQMLNKAVALAERVKSRAKMGVFPLLRLELYGDALRAFQGISHVHSREVSRQPKVKL